MGHGQSNVRKKDFPIGDRSYAETSGQKSENDQVAAENLGNNLNMSVNRPLISVGIPVYNGEKYLRRAIDSVLEQDYDNFELLISDNASADATAKICQEYTERDGRIRYFMLLKI